MSDPIRVVKAAQRTEASGPATPGIRRSQAFVSDNHWVGYVTTEPGMLSGWHHHGDHETFFYVVEGEISLEFGRGGAEQVTPEVGDFVSIPKRLVHREGTPPGRPAAAVLVRVGSGPPVVPVDGPSEA